MYDTQAVLRQVDLAAMVEGALGQPIKRSGRWLFWRCPFHPGDESPSLGVTRENGRWFCFACRKGGDAITWLRDYAGLTFTAACEALGAVPAEAAALGTAEARSEGVRWPDDRQAAWRVVIERCQAMLWSPTGQRARDYLHGRGLNDATLQSPFARVGYSPGMEIEGAWVERGIVLPCFTTTRDLGIEYVSYIKIRRPVGRPTVGARVGAKYWKLPGGGACLAGLYGAAWVRGADVVFVTEGEFDALLLNQAAGDLVGVCTLGGAGDRFNQERFGKYLAAAQQVVIAYDNDPAGQRGAEAWQAASPRVMTAGGIPDGKDITDFWLRGGDLAGWVMEVLRK